MNPSRRDFILNTLFGTGWVGLRSLATGIPPLFFIDPARAVAQATSPAATRPPQYLIFNTSRAGDPVNCNVPGTYEDSGIVHPSDSSMAKTHMTLNGAATSGAAAWANLPQSSVLDRTCFFHHGTYTVVHPNEPQVLSLVGAAHDMLPSLISNQLAATLGTIQIEPVVLGGETISYQGRPQPNLGPLALKTTLLAPSGALGTLQSLRDQSLNQLNAQIRSGGNPAQQQFIDQYVNSQSQARLISQSLLEQLNAIADNSQDSQIAAAIVMVQMKVSPVFTVHMNFGDDNHTDPGLAGEAAASANSINSLAKMATGLAAAGLQDHVSFASLNVFGRTLTTTDGRTHHGDHHCAVLIGKPFKGGVIGGVEAFNKDFRAMSIDPSSGAGVPNDQGAITFENSLTAMAVTLGTAVGVSPSFLAQRITGGQVVPAALA